MTISNPVSFFKLLTKLQKMSLLVRCNHFKRLPRFQVKLLSFLSSFSTSASKPPPPICIGITDSVGRGVFATRRICAGELIHTAEPIVSHPSLSFLNVVCYFCLRKLSNQSANFDSSQIASFCSERCEKQSENFYKVEKMADWSRFYEYCRLQGVKYPLLVKRLACQVISGTVSPDVLDILQPEILSAEKISKMKKEVFLLRSTFEHACIESERMAFLTEEWYTGALARIRINAFCIELPGGSYEDLFLAAASVEAETAVGNAVYMLPSFYNHDCDPNVNILWIDNADAKLKSLCDIEAGKFL